MIALGSLLAIGAANAPVAAADPAPIVQRDANTVTADALPTVQIDGVVWTQLIVGNTVYAGGEFQKARPAGAAPGTNETTRSNLLAYNLTTGVLITSFAPVMNAQVKALAVSPDGKRVYVGGSFTTAGGVARNRIAAFNTSDGTLVGSFAPAINSTVNSISVTDTAVYVGGAFSKVGSVSRARLAAFNPTNGALLGWAPTADSGVNALLVTPDKSRVIVAGSFGTINASTATGLAAIDITSGALLPWIANTVVHNYGTSAAMLSLSTDGTNVYSTGYWFGGTGNFEGVLAADANTGAIKWLADCHGDTYDATPMNGVVYAVSHWHYCSNIGGFPDTNPRNVWHRADAMTVEAKGTVAHNGQGGYYDFYGTPAPAMVNWFPEPAVGSYTGQTQAGWSTTSNSQYLLQGGEFPTVNGVGQQGLVRYAIGSLAPKKQGPRVAGAAFNPSLLAVSNQSVRIKWQANWDRDDQDLTYTVVRSGTALPIYTTKLTSQFWNRPTMSYTDNTVTAGQTYKYRVTAADGDGNTVQSEIVNITVPTTVNPYVTDVISDGASDYWRMNGTGSYPDYAGSTDLTATAGVTAAAAGALTGDSDGAASFDGSTGAAATSTPVPGPNTFTAEAWFKTTTTSGGKIVGFGNASTGNSSGYDRHIYMDNSGRLTFGVYNGTTTTLRSSAAYNDGQWHQAVGEMSPAGMAFYVDGIKIGSNGVTTGQDYSGFWRVGADNLGSWPNQPSSGSFNGTIDEVAIYPTALTAAQLRDHYTRSGRTVSLPSAPTDAYGKAVFDDGPSLFWRLNETSGSTAADASEAGVTGLYSGGVTQGTASTVTTSGTAVTFDGTNGTVASSAAFTNPTTYSEELWFKTTTTRGGKLIGFGDAQSGTSSNYDRHVYMENSGQLTFGTYTGQLNTTTSPTGYNNGQWHQLVATQGADGMKLYVDGALVGTNPQTSAQSYSGYWRIGGDSSWAADNFFNGSIDEAAVYPTALTAAQVQAHYQASPASSPPASNAPPVAAFTSACTGGACTFDSSGSADSDGSIASYAWTFGDSTTSTEASPTHGYTTSGTYPVSLTVTDNKGATATVQHAVTVTVPVANQLPVAAFTSDCTELVCAFDSSTSADTDGTVASVAWDFGDSGTSTAAKPNHTFAAAGTYNVKLTVTDDQGATDSVTKAVTVSAATANQDPTSSFTSSSSGLTASFDGSASADPDGTVASYAWTFGDGSTGTGKTASRTYAGTGTYTVKLTVTDDDGATASLTKKIVVGSGVVAKDAFDRSVTKWGSADQGGAWTLTGSTFSTNGDTGNVKLAAAGTAASAYLNAVSQQNVNVVADVAVDSMATGAGTSTTLITRRIGTSDYRMTLKQMPAGAIRLNLTRIVSGTSTSLKDVNLSGVTYGAGDVLRMRFVVSGSGTTSLTGKVWKVGAAEPTASQISASDTTAGLQAPGSFGIYTYLSGSSTTVPVTLSLDNLLLTSG